MFSLMNGQRIAAESDGAVSLDDIMRRGVREKSDIGALASFETNKVCVMVWHYHDDDVAAPNAQIKLTLTGLPATVNEAKLTHYRVDANHSNAYDEWRRMGSPIAPDQRQYRRLQEASDLATLVDVPSSTKVDGGVANLEFSLPRQGVSLIVLSW
jgi:xylan 1,4-beta-xylosidase